MQQPRAEGATRLQLAFAERMMNDMAESAKLYWKGRGPLGQQMIEAVEEWANMQRRYFESLGGTQEKQAGEGEPRGEARTVSSVPSWPWVSPLRGLTYDPWPGPGASEGGGWDR